MSKWILAFCLIALVTAKADSNKQQGMGVGAKVVIWLGMIGIACGLAYYIDKRNNFQYSRAVRGKIGDCIMMIRRKRSYTKSLSQKVEPEDNQTARNPMYDHEKTYVEAIPQANPGTQQVLHEEPVLPQEIQSDTPEPDFKGVFEIKQSKSKHKANKKSRSKLKGRLLGKGSDNEQEQQDAGDLSNMTDENETEERSEKIELDDMIVSNNNDDYKVMEDETDA